jgi:hypothetical protein
MTGNLLTTAEVAERLGVSSWAVAQAVRAGALEPSARTNDDFLFTERAVAAFAERKAEAAATPLEPPPSLTRAEWSGDVDRLNAWLQELNESAPAGARPTDTIAMPMPLPAAPPGLVPAPPPAPGIAAAPAPEPVPIVGRTILERIAAGQPAAAPQRIASPEAAKPIPTAAQPEPEPEPEPREPEPLTPVTWPEPAAPAEPSAVVPIAPAELVPPAPAEPVPAVAAEPAPVPPVERPPTPGVGLSRQALLVVQPVVRFRVLRDVTERLATVQGIADARLERLEGGVASYRVSFEGERPSSEAIGEALAALNLEVMLVDSYL